MAKLMVQLTKPAPLNPAEFVNPPAWVVRLVSTNFGKPGKRYPLGWTRVENYYKDSNDSDLSSMMPWGYAGEVLEEAKQSQPWGPNRPVRNADVSVVIRGNLREEQYRFWNGSGSALSEIATCRWCRHWAYGQEAMRDHQSLTDHTRILREIYDCARGLSRRMCFVCKASTHSERWGIPLCDGNKCRNKWRVAPIADVSSTLLTYAKYAFLKGLLRPWIDENKHEIHNLEERPKAFNWERADAY